MQVQKTPRPRRPKVKISLPARTLRKSFNLPDYLCEHLAQYTKFLTAYHKSEVSEDSVLHSLLSKLARDKAFRAWLEQEPA